MNKSFKTALQHSASNISVLMQVAVDSRNDTVDKVSKNKYRKLAIQLEKSLKALDRALEMIGE
jgi:hypothetical protein